ncbi:MFS general substrate transporter [Aspergillus fijiensis CBS 313.89]|uniref:MFS general substrate transporter n=1 Tax=Aspergillus fijiensis CBS 313.89 TaxID=1448319 RepID=A0A8G1RQA8_9EURO|nr:MFS general substrate transporter [Aspergillus fijiensis CBS 313.89]RAK74706.1 MFS general substrate transporter [Aspergillus fijiensis CBS 313.89]
MAIEDIRRALRTPSKSTSRSNVPEIPRDESPSARIERLGRERPSAFSNPWTELFCIFGIVMSQFLTEFFVSGFTVILPPLAQDLKIPQASQVWPATAFSLVISSTLLIFGRLGDIWGGYPLFFAGLAWLLIWSVVAGFSSGAVMLNICRALQGLGAAAFLPNGVMIIGSLYRPGPRKNLVFAIYGTAGVLGFFGGIAIAGVVGQCLRWSYYFWIGAALAAITLATAICAMPYSTLANDSRRQVKMDYVGGVGIVCGLVFTIFAITQSAHAPSGWKTPYVLATFLLGVMFLAGTWYVEQHVVSDPLLPASLFAVKSMTPLLIALLLLYGTWGIFSVNGSLYFQNVLSASPLQVVVWYIPIGVVGLVVSVIEGYTLHLVPGHVLMIVSGLAAVGSQLLLALIPPGGGSYWAWIFPSAILSTIGIDLSTILMTVFITTAVPSSQQGLAGGVLNSVLQLGVAFVLGFTDIIQSAVVKDRGLEESYKATFWFGVGVAGASLIILMIWGRIPKAVSELTADEKQEHDSL